MSNVVGLIPELFSETTSARLSPVQTMTCGDAAPPVESHLTVLVTANSVSITSHPTDTEKLTLPQTLLAMIRRIDQDAIKRPSQFRRQLHRLLEIIPHELLEDLKPLIVLEQTQPRTVFHIPLFQQLN